MPGRGSIYRFGPVELDAPRGRLFRGQTRVPLPESQCSILLQLLTRVGEVVSKDALANAAWRGAAVTDNSLDQAISRLRKALSSGRDRARYIDVKTAIEPRPYVRQSRGTSLESSGLSAGACGHGAARDPGEWIEPPQ